MKLNTSTTLTQQLAELKAIFEAKFADQERRIELQDERIALQEEKITLQEKKIKQQTARIVELEAIIKEKDQIIIELRAQLALQQHMLFGRSSEHGKKALEEDPKKLEPSPNPSPSPKTGKKGGRKKRRDHSDLPLITQDIELPEDEQKCSCCGLSFEYLSDVEEGETIEIDVKGYRKKVKRKSYIRKCKCVGAGPKIITADSPGKIIPKGSIGTSVWIKILMDKFLFYMPTYRTLDQLILEGIDLPQATINDGMRKIKDLLNPIYDAICERNKTEEQWNADETGWLVQEKIEGKESTRWYIWVFKAATTVVYKLSSNRAASTVLEHLGAADGTISCDRYSSYKKHAKDTEGNISLAYCWAHVRRDYLRIGKSYPTLEKWAKKVVEEEIRLLYELFRGRRAVYLANGETSKEFKVIQKKFSKEMNAFYERRMKELEKPSIEESKRAVNESLKEHWHGLTEVVENPELDMDNNAAERALRGPVIGRKNFWGSIAEWSGTFAVMLFTLFQTCLLWGINPKKWLELYFADCAANKGRAPINVDKYLPWNMSQEMLSSLSENSLKSTGPPG